MPRLTLGQYTVMFFLSIGVYELVQAGCGWRRGFVPHAQPWDLAMVGLINIALAVAVRLGLSWWQRRGQRTSRV